MPYRKIIIEWIYDQIDESLAVQQISGWLQQLGIENPLDVIQRARTKAALGGRKLSDALMDEYIALAEKQPGPPHIPDNRHPNEILMGRQGIIPSTGEELGSPEHSRSLALCTKGHAKVQDAP